MLLDRLDRLDRLLTNSMKIQEIRDLNIEQLKKLVDEKRTQAVKLRFDIAVRQLKNHRQYRAIKTDIARILTIIKQRENQA